MLVKQTIIYIQSDNIKIPFKQYFFIMTPIHILILNKGATVILGRWFQHKRSKLGQCFKLNKDAETQNNIRLQKQQFIWDNVVFIVKLNLLWNKRVCCFV